MTLDENSDKFKWLMKKNKEQLQILALEKGYEFAKNPNWPKKDYASAIMGIYPFSNRPHMLSQEQIQEAIKDVKPKPKVKPIEPATFLVQIQKGKNAGKYMLETMHGARYSMKRFANIPIYIATDNDVNRHTWSVFNNKEDAEEWANQKWKQGREVVKELILTADQIV